MAKKSAKGEMRDEIDISWVIEGVPDKEPSGGQQRKIEVATDLALMDLVGMREKAFDDEYGYLCYDSAGLEVMFFRARGPVAGPKGWAVQPGYDGGTVERLSFAVELAPADFDAAVARLRAAGVATLPAAPEWRQDSYLGLNVVDPAGTTVELFTVPPKKPA